MESSPDNTPRPEGSTSSSAESKERSSDRWHLGAETKETESTRDRRDKLKTLLTPPQDDPDSILERRRLWKKADNLIKFGEGSPDSVFNRKAKEEGTLFRAQQLVHEFKKNGLKSFDISNMKFYDLKAMRLMGTAYLEAGYAENKQRNFDQLSEEQKLMVRMGETIGLVAEGEMIRRMMKNGTLDDKKAVQAHERYSRYVKNRDIPDILVDKFKAIDSLIVKNLGSDGVVEESKQDSRTKESSATAEGMVFEQASEELLGQETEDMLKKYDTYDEFASDKPGLAEEFGGAAKDEGFDSPAAYWLQQKLLMNDSLGDETSDASRLLERARQRRDKTKEVLDVRTKKGSRTTEREKILAEQKQQEDQQWLDMLQKEAMSRGRKFAHWAKSAHDNAKDRLNEIALERGLKNGKELWDVLSHDKEERIIKDTEWFDMFKAEGLKELAGVSYKDWTRRAEKFGGVERFVRIAESNGYDSPEEFWNTLQQEKSSESHREKETPNEKPEKGTEKQQEKDLSSEADSAKIFFEGKGLSPKQEAKLKRYQGLLQDEGWRNSYGSTYEKWVQGLEKKEKDTDAKIVVAAAEKLNMEPTELWEQLKGNA